MHQTVKKLNGVALSALLLKEFINESIALSSHN